jgi:MOSC domain-containing protein YiiM
MTGPGAGRQASRPSPPERVRLDGLYAGGITLIGPAQHRTGIVKGPQDRVSVNVEGIVGDVQVDRRFHGGRDKAVHHFPADHYPELARRFPAAAERLVPGSLGENLSTLGWTDADVAIGDVYGAGTVVLQVTQPRSPCWKINERLGEPDASRWIADRGITGWYCRVLAGGVLRGGDELVRLERPAAPVPLREFWRTVQAHRPRPADLERMVSIPGLAADWRRRLQERLEWLAKGGDGSRQS